MGGDGNLIQKFDKDMNEIEQGWQREWE